ncbi:diaminopimelate decarboxylase [Rhodococcus opacus]|uniref:diaminopimelate decarboxylase n=1 Tax=Rhodococcus opacus TaxID=37919 RepID=UPI001F574FE9|nr:diaminopimelate decarboxylase [Rhodococcus opacus]UNM99843.1 diaminopimelate decarboxylase [Rhodococcus opacus]
MTLLDILPSLRGTTTSRLDPTVWPVTTHYRHGRITVGGVDLGEVADRFGTPTYVLDEAGLRGAGATISRGFRHAEVLCGTSSLLTGGVARAVAGLRLSLVVHSRHEAVLARRNGVDPDRIVLLIGPGGSGSGPAVTLAAGGVGRIVVDAGVPIDTIGVPERGPHKTIARVHDYRSADALVGRVIDAPALELIGVRCDAAPNPDDIRDRVLTAVAVMCDAYREHRVLMTELHVGISTDGTVIDGASGLGDALENPVEEACIRNRFPRPRIAVDFGDSITGRAAVTVTRVRGVDRTDSGRPVIVEGSAGSAIAVTAGEPVAAAIANRHPLGPTEIFPIVDSRGVMGDHFCSGVVLSQDIRAGDVVALVGRDGRDLLDSAQVVSVAHGRIHQIPAE